MSLLEIADELDAVDPLRGRRDLFALADNLIYLDGNSLGPPTKAALERLRRVGEEEWRVGLIRSWNEADWVNLPNTAGAKIARIIGVDSGDVIVADSVSVNIFKLAAALKRLIPSARLCTESAEFPTDIYVLDGLKRLLGETVGAAGDGAIILVRSAVDFRTGAVADIEATEKEVSSSGGAVIWDLSHAAGLLDLRLGERGVRFAVGCGYKFLNGGPGAPAFIYARADMAETLRQPISGWMGHERPFDFSASYEPSAGVRRFAAGTPPILSLAALDAALEAFDGVDMREVQAKARRLGDLFLDGVADLGLASLAPPAESRGGHVSLSHNDGYAVMQALIRRGVIGDFRPPDIMRFGFSPLFLSHSDVARAGDILARVLKAEEWRDPRFSERRLVP
jgi:kynureninase